MGRTIITGGAGFLGRKLAQRLVGDDQDIDDQDIDDQDIDLLLADRAPADGWSAGERAVEVAVGDVADGGFIDRVVTAEVDRVFHLASVVSAGAEQDFDLGYGVNLLGTLALLERCRRAGTERGRPIQLIFASSLATYGSAAGNPVGDATAQRPESSYGVQKACCELLINDYHRKGFIDGRCLRLPTVVVRPGKPNLAASGFASGIIREPLNGMDMTCPVSEETVMAVISPRRVVDALARIGAVDSAEIGPDRTVLLPGLAMSMAEAVEATRSEGGDRSLGRVSFDPDPDVQRIIDSWPPSLTSDRAHRLGLVGDQSVAAIVRQHIEDELEC